MQKLNYCRINSRRTARPIQYERGIQVESHLARRSWGIVAEREEGPCLTFTHLDHEGANQVLQLSHWRTLAVGVIERKRFRVPIDSDALPEVRILAIPRGRDGDRVHEPLIDASASL
jgi:hypothetical protein